MFVSTKVHQDGGIDEDAGTERKDDQQRLVEDDLATPLL